MDLAVIRAVRKCLFFHAILDSVALQREARRVTGADYFLVAVDRGDDHPADLFSAPPRPGGDPRIYPEHRAVHEKSDAGLSQAAAGSTGRGGGGGRARHAF